MSPDERRTLSADYTQLAKRLERGSSQNMRLLEKAIRINPSNDLAHYELSIPYLHNGMYEKWNNHITQAVELNPQAWQGWRGYSKLFFLRDYGGALVDLDATDTLTVDKTDYAQNMSVDYLRALCYLGLNNLEKSREYFMIYTEKEEASVGEKFVNENAFLYLAIIELMDEKPGTALEYLNRAVKFEEGLADMYFHKARALYKLNFVKEARESFEKAKALFDEGRYLRGYRYEAIEQIYESDFQRLKDKLFSEV
ncbi:MAG: hypothetical protein HKO89_03135 [Saprospiraceae bacterium]|nr:hypothetical protein [Saprospiraceae bacterium]